MDPVWIAVALIGGYLLGSISFARIVTRAITGQDVTQFDVPVSADESYKAQSIGGNTVSSRLGAKYGMLTGILDMLKVALPVLALKLAFPGQPYHLMFAVSDMAGHIWPVYYRFHGGSGWSPAFGSLLVIDWLGALLTPVLGFIFGMFIVRMVSLAIISWMWFVIPWLWFRTHDLWHLLYAVAINILFLLSMIPETRIMAKYKAEGRLLEYGHASLAVNPMGRGFLKMAEKFHVKLS